MFVRLAQDFNSLATAAPRVGGLVDATFVSIYPFTWLEGGGSWVHFKHLG